MLQWQREFIAQLRAGIPPERACRSAAGMSLKEVLDAKEKDAEFSNAWDSVIEPEGGRGRLVTRRLDGQMLEELLWAQCSDEEAAAYFNLTLDEFNQLIAADKELTRIHQLARKGGIAQIKLTQARQMSDTPNMTVWLGKQHAGQSDKVDAKVEQITVQMDTRELARRWLYLMESVPAAELADLRRNSPIIDVKSKHIIEVPVDED